MRLSKEQVAALAAGAGLAWQVPPPLLASLAYQESGWNTTPAHGPRWKDELGILQIRPATARWLGYSGDLQDLVSDPARSFDLAGKYLFVLRQTYGPAWPPVVSAYNAGHPIQGNLDSYVRPILERAGLLRPSSSLVPLAVAGLALLVLARAA